MSIYKYFLHHLVRSLIYLAVEFFVIMNDCFGSKAAILWLRIKLTRSKADDYQYKVL